MPLFPSAAVAGGSLVVGFAVAEATGIRWLGGLVLVAAAAACGLRWWRSAGGGTAAVLLLAYAGGFVGAHLLAGLIGAWPAVLAVAAGVGALAWLLADRREATRRPPAGRAAPVRTRPGAGADRPR